MLFKLCHNNQQVRRFQYRSCIPRCQQSWTRSTPTITLVWTGPWQTSGQRRWSPSTSWIGLIKLYSYNQQVRTIQSPNPTNHDHHRAQEQKQPYILHKRSLNLFYFQINWSNNLYDGNNLCGSIESINYNDITNTKWNDDGEVSLHIKMVIYGNGRWQFDCYCRF